MSFATLVMLLGLAGPTPPPAASLPVVLLAPATRPSHTIAVLITGDGGWAETDRAIARRLSSQGDGVIVLNSLHYFARLRSPATIAADLSTLARMGCARWSCRRIVLVGYSMGADVLPFAVRLLPPDVRSRVVQLLLISLSRQASFRFFPTQWLGIDLWPTVATVPELARLRGLSVVCIYGTGDRDAACRDLPAGQATLIPVPSGHVMAGVADRVAQLVADHVRLAAGTRPAPLHERSAR